MSEIVLRAENLKKVFVSGKKEFTAVDDVSFELKRGECLGIVGESGSGKSTIAQMITHLEAATEGRIFLKEQDITHVRGKALRDIYQDIQMVFQMPMESFDPRCTLGDGIGESLRNMGISRDETRKRVENLLEKCGMEKEYADRYPHQVSGGQCQRAAIARALAVNPEILICDEATSALDVTVQKQILELLKELKEKEELSFLFICHDLALVQEFCDKVLVLYQGKVVECGLRMKSSIIRRWIIQRNWLSQFFSRGLLFHRQVADYAYDDNWKRMFTVVSTYNKKIATYIKMEYLCIPQGGLLTI